MGGDMSCRLKPSRGEKWLSPLPYHRAWDCRAGPGASPPHRGHPHSWAGGSSSFGSSGIGPHHSSGHTGTRGSSVTSPQALCWKESSLRGWLRWAPTFPDLSLAGHERRMWLARQAGHLGGQGARPPGGGSGEGCALLTSRCLTWARTQAAEATLLVGSEDVGAPVSAWPRGPVRSQAALLAHPAAARARFPEAPGGPGTVPWCTARAGAQGLRLCGTQ